MVHGVITRGMEILCYLKEDQSEIMEEGRLVKMMRRGRKVVRRSGRRTRDRGKCKKEVSSEVENLNSNQCVYDYGDAEFIEHGPGIW